jgi:hypothetical protein
MTGVMTRTVSKAEEAFTAVMTVGNDFASRVEEAQVAGDTTAEALAMAFGMAEMQDAIAKHKEASDVIARAAGHKWGFKTDNDTEGKGSNYDKPVLIACFCEAALKKLKVVGNEFNVIQSGVYVTREGWEGKLERLPGVTEVDIIPGAINEYDEKEYTTKVRTSRDGKMYGGEQKTKLVAYVSATASCKVWGQHVEVRAWKYPDGRDERLQLTGTADIVEAMIDQLKGKACARIAEQLFRKCVGLSRRGPVNQQAEHTQVIQSPLVVVEPSAERIEVVVVAEASERPVPTAVEFHAGNYDRCLKMLSSDPSAAAVFQDIWKTIADVKTLVELDAIAKDSATLFRTFSKDVQGKIKAFSTDRRSELTQVQHESKH